MIGGRSSTEIVGSDNRAAPGSSAGATIGPEHRPYDDGPRRAAPHRSVPAGRRRRGGWLTGFARNDAECEKKAGCPDSPYLAARDIFTATDTRFVVDQLARPPSSVHRKETHEVTVVLLDGNGRRVGETAFAVEFQVVREQG